MNLIKCYMPNSTWFKGAGTHTPKGIVFHSTGCNNPNLWRWVQPADDAPDREQLINVIGYNKYKTDWEHIYREAGVNAWIGKLKDGSIATVQAGPWDKIAWGVGSPGIKTLNESHIQFEICEDDLSDEKYFRAVYKEAIELCAYLCIMYNLDPLGTMDFHGKQIPVITDHRESHTLGVGGNHGDIRHWATKYMSSDYLNTIRKDIYNEMHKNDKPQTETPKETQQDVLYRVQVGAYKVKANAEAQVKKLKALGIDCFIVEVKQNTTTTTPVVEPLKVGDTVKMAKDATVYGKTTKFASWVYNATLYVRQINGDRIVVSTLKTGDVTGAVDRKYLTKV